MLSEIEFPELFIGIVAPVGVRTADTIEQLKLYFRSIGYNPVEIKVTSSFSRFSKHVKPHEDLNKDRYYARIKSFIAYGNQLRRETEENSLLAGAAVAMIQTARLRSMSLKERRGKVPPSFSKRVFIINQLKRPEELELLRKIYGSLFFQLSIYSNRSSRVKGICAQIDAEKQYGNKEDSEELARGLVATDENEASDSFGQQVGKVFHDADFIVNADIISPSVGDQVRRFCDLLFGANTISPSKDEYGLHMAKGAALRTLDLSRQVGAAVFSETSEILSLGTNEVPKSGGGTYWANSSGIDAREYVLQGDSNDRRKRLVVRELYSLVLQREFTEEEFLEFLGRKEVNASMAMDAIEYGRVVHAEMNAITDAARCGHALRGSTLYCTTFPCHICAKHIVASGVDRVVYLEPYPKSLAQELHDDPIEIDGMQTGRFENFPKTKFQHFFGVTPRRFREFFERGKRKGSDGKLQAYVRGRQRPIVKVIQPHYLPSEDLTRLRVNHLGRFDQ